MPDVREGVAAFRNAYVDRNTTLQCNCSIIRRIPPSSNNSYDQLCTSRRE